MHLPRSLPEKFLTSSHGPIGIFSKFGSVGKTQHVVLSLVVVNSSSLLLERLLHLSNNPAVDLSTFVYIYICTHTHIYLYIDMDTKETILRRLH